MKLTQLALSLLTLGGAVPGTAQQAQSADLELATFDAAWRIVWETHFDTTFNGVNWKGLRDEFRPRAVGAPRDSVRGLIRTMLGRLGQSHFALITADAVDSDPAARSRANGTLGMEVRLIEGAITVTKVDPNGAAAAAGIKTGWIVAGIDSNRVDSLLARLKSRPSRNPLGLRSVSSVNGWLSGTPGSMVSLLLLDGSNQPVTLNVTRRADPSIPVKWGHFPTFFARFASREVTDNGTRVGVIWFNNWLVPLVRQVDSAVDAYRGHDGIVLDLRGNTGGVAAMVGGLAGHFTPRPDTLGRNQTRSMTMYFVANPRRATMDGRQVTPFAGPVAVLTDELSGSASEVFAGGMQALGRIRVFGDTSIGGVLPAIWDKLPNGDVLYHATGEFVTSTGERLEGRGVLPDQPVAVTRADLLAGRDPVLDAAVRWIGSQRGTKNPGGIP